MPGALAIVLILGGLFFFLAGTVGLIRFPDLYCRLHAVTKADNAGLGLIAAGTAILSGTASTAALIMLIWVLAMTAATVACHLIARHSLRDNTGGGPQ